MSHLDYGRAREMPPLTVIFNLLSSTHFYPPSNSILASSSALATNAHKVFIVGEFDWTNRYYQPLGYLIVLLPALLAASVWLMPARWWPWTCGCGGRQKRATQYENVADDDGARYPPHRLSTGASHALPKADSATILAPPPRRARLAIRRWHFSLALLLLAPVAAGIIYSLLPTQRNSFLGKMESLAAADALGGSFYWSLFGRDNACCGYVQHADGYTLHYPSDPAGEGGAESIGSGDAVRALANHALTLQGAPLVSSLARLPVVACPQSNLTVQT